MNEKITITGMSALLAEHLGLSQSECSAFLKEFFSLISETLASGEGVKIKGFGVFKLLEVDSRKSVDVTTGQDMQIPSHTKVSFVPAKELAEKVNSFFDFFEVVEINEGVSEDDLTLGNISTDDENDSDSEDIITIPDSMPATTKAVSENVDDYVLEETERIEELIEKEVVTAETEIKEEMTSTEAETDDRIASDETEIEEEPVKSRRRFARGFFCGFIFAIAVVALVFGVAAYFKMETLSDNLEKLTAVKEAVSVKDQVNVEENKKSETLSDTVNRAFVREENPESDVPEELVETMASDEVVYDMITDTRYLTTMAKAHYGNYNLWPYIYEENKKILGHPNRIRPGTKIVIPSLAKYGVDPKNPEDIAKAKKLGASIYARYN